MNRIFIKKSIEISCLLLCIFVFSLFFSGHVHAQTDPFDAGNVYDSFDAGNYDPNNIQYDFEGWQGSTGPVSTPADSGPGLGACGSKIEKLQDILTLANCYISTGFVPLIFTLALIYFILGVIKYVVSDSEKDKAKGRQFMIWGIVALFAMVSVWGLVKVIGNTFGITADVKVLPMLPE